MGENSQVLGESTPREKEKVNPNVSYPSRTRGESAREWRKHARVDLMRTKTWQGVGRKMVARRGEVLR